MAIMESLPAWFMVVLAGACLGGGVLAAVAQISVRALGQEQQQALAQNAMAPRALRAWLDAPLRMMLSTVLLRVGMPAMAAWLMAQAAQEGWPTLALGWRVPVATVLFHMVVGEVIFASWAKHRAKEVALVALAAFLPFDVLLWPVSAALALVARKIAARLAPQDSQAVQSGPFLMEQDMARLWGLVPEAGQGARPQHRLWKGVQEFQEATVRDVMVPRARIMAVEVETPLPQLLSAFGKSGHTRLPVFQGSLDQVVGVLFLTDLLRMPADSPPAHVRPLMRRPYFVPELMKVADLLREFQKRRTHLALVVDEFGTTSGMVTLQDLIEEIVGDVRDEEDRQEPNVKRLTDTSWSMDGRTGTDAVGAVLGTPFPEHSGYETLGGFLTTRLGRLPGPGTTHRWNGWLFTVKEADEKRVVRVVVERSLLTPSDPPPL